MSVLSGEVIVCDQHDGEAVALAVYGDEFYARYETESGYTVVYDTDVGCYCYATCSGGHFVSTGAHVGKPVPPGIRRHLKESPQVRNQKFLQRHTELRPTEIAQPSHEARTLGPAGGLLSGRRLTQGQVTGLTILVNFDDIDSNISHDDVDQMLNAEAYSTNSNFCSVRKYFEIVSSGKLEYSNYVVGPVQLSKRRSHYINNLLVEEALDLARIELQSEGKSLSDFDSRGEGVIDALNILYAGRTQYSGNLWPHNSVEVLQRDGVRTHFYLLTSMGRETVDLSIGTFCHENGHLLCRFPDMYDYGSRDGDGEKSEGIGQFCLMGSGNHNNQGRTPSPACGYLRDLAGWADNEVWLDQHNAVDAVHGDYNTVMKYPTDRLNEYFIVENRTRMGLDSGLPDSGLAVYHCDTMGSNEWQEGSSDRHYQCALLQADGHLDLENNRNRGDAGDLFPETTGIALSHVTTPSSLQWDGSDSGLQISEVSAPGDVISLNIGGVVDTDDQLMIEVSPDLLIPDNQQAGVRSSITIAQQGKIHSVSVSIDIIHTWIGDLLVTLEHPDGDKIILHNSEGNSGDDIIKTYSSDDFTALSGLIGKPMNGIWNLHIVDNAGQDIGRLNRWSLDIGYKQTSNIFEQSIAANLTIPDHDLSGVRSEILVAVAGKLVDIEVSVNIEHTYIGDLLVVLISPNGVSANLHLYEGGSRNNLVAIYKPGITPNLTPLIGLDIEGEWVLKVVDRAAIDVGKLLDWSLKLIY